MGPDVQPIPRYDSNFPLTSRFCTEYWLACITVVVGSPCAHFPCERARLGSDVYIFEEDADGRCPPGSYLSVATGLCQACEPGSYGKDSGLVGAGCPGVRQSRYWKGVHKDVGAAFSMRCAQQLNWAEVFRLIAF